MNKDEFEDLGNLEDLLAQQSMQEEAQAETLPPSEEEMAQAQAMQAQEAMAQQEEATPSVQEQLQAKLDALSEQMAQMQEQMQAQNAQPTMSEKDPKQAYYESIGLNDEMARMQEMQAKMASFEEYMQAQKKAQEEATANAQMTSKFQALGERLKAKNKDVNLEDLASLGEKLMTKLGEGDEEAWETLMNLKYGTAKPPIAQHSINATKEPKGEETQDDIAMDIAKLLM